MNLAQPMPLIPFDTLAFANKLKEAGLEPKIAEAQAELQAAVMIELATNQLATKKDLQELKLELLTKIGGIVVACSTILGVLLSIIIRAH
jgi:hypothetical protein